MSSVLYFCLPIKEYVVIVITIHRSIADVLATWVYTGTCLIWRLNNFTVVWTEERQPKFTAATCIVLI